MNNRINCLHCLIKEQAKLKGRKLKIICDWDDCIQPLKPVIAHRMLKSIIRFDLFFKVFWKSSVVETLALSKETHEVVSPNEEERKLIEEFEKVRDKVKNDPEMGWIKFMEIYGSEERFKIPFTTIGRELLLSLKEDLIDDLLIISSFGIDYNDPADIKYTLLDNEGKLEKFQATFGQFPQSKFELTEMIINKEGKYVPYRWEKIKSISPDFDIFIDDQVNNIKGTKENFSQNVQSLYLLPNYVTTKNIQSSDIYYLATTIASNLKDEDFAQAAAKYYKNSLVESNNKKIEKSDQFFLVTKENKIFSPDK